MRGAGTVDNCLADESRVERVYQKSARHDDVLARKAEIFEVCTGTDEDGIVRLRGLNSSLDGSKLLRYQPTLGEPGLGQRDTQRRCDTEANRTAPGEKASK